MEDATNYLEGLPRISPVDEAAPPLGASGLRRGPKMTSQEVMIALGVSLVLVCGLLLFFVYACASKAVGDLFDDPRYWPEVLREMFDRFALGAVPAVLGVLLGVILLTIAICRGRSSDPGASGGL